MKTSNIIFTALISAFSIVILAAILDVRINGELKYYHRTDNKVHRQTIPPFKVLYMSDCKLITLVQADSSFVQSSYTGETLPPEVKNYKVKGDTLMIFDIDLAINSNTNLKIYCASSLKKIVLKNSDIRIGRMSSPDLSFDIDNSHVFNGLSGNEKNRFSGLDIIARNGSVIHLSAFGVDSTNIVLQQSNAILDITARVISGTLSDASRLRVTQMEYISVKTDASSKIVINDR